MPAHRQTSFISFQEQMPDFQLTLARNPIGNSGGRGEYAEGAHFSINSSSSDEKKEAAAKLMNFWVNIRNSLITVTRYMPAAGSS